MPEGDRSKNLATVSRLYDGLVKAGLGREDGVLALGGGVVGDTAGFAAATYLRGVSLAQAPTTLLSQIDSSLGGKVGVNHRRGKNLIGAFHRPAAVVIDPEVLRTLPQREWSSGLFELLKYGFIGSPALFRLLESRPRALRRSRPLLARAITQAVKIKLRVVRADERESGERRILNFGHTVGHALEAAGGYHRLSHGEAVGWGMVAAVRLAAARGDLGGAQASRMERAVRGLAPLPSLAGLSLGRVLRALEHDKKIGPARALRFVMPVAPGRVTLVENLPRSEVRAVVRSLLRG
jgi:3-dehydroquinate synthase